MSVSFIAVSIVIGLICGLGTAFSKEMRRRLPFVGQLVVLIAVCGLLVALVALAGQIRRGGELSEVTTWFGIAAVALGFALPVLLLARNRTR